MNILLTALPGALYLTGILAAVLVALASNDTHRRADACKVLRMLLSPLPKAKPQRQKNHTEALTKSNNSTCGGQSQKL
jgi:hypothetical protein